MISDGIRIESRYDGNDIDIVRNEAAEISAILSTKKRISGAIDLVFPLLGGAMYTIQVQDRIGGTAYRIGAYSATRDQTPVIELHDDDRDSGALSIFSFFYTTTEAAKAAFRKSSGPRWPGYGPRGMLLVQYLGMILGYKTVSLIDTWERVVNYDDGRRAYIDSEEYARLIESVVYISEHVDDGARSVLTMMQKGHDFVSTTKRYGALASRVKAVMTSEYVSGSTSFRNKLALEAAAWPTAGSFRSWYGYFGFVDIDEKQPLADITNTASIIHV